MKSVERMEAVLHGERPDRWPFVPSVYEHGAALLGKDPGVVSRDRELMAEAALESYRRYDHDIVTVGRRWAARSAAEASAAFPASYRIR